jgi:hypothetical protein
MGKYLYVRVPDDAHAWVAGRAATEGVSMGEIVRRLIDREKVLVTLHRDDMQVNTYAEEK